MSNRILSKKEAGEVFEVLVKYFDATRNIELDFINPYTLLVAVILSAQATDKSVNLATKGLFELVQTPEAMVALGEEKLKQYIKTIGLYNTKAKNVITMSQQLIERHNSLVPNTREELTALAGVGRKTANIILNSVFGIPSIAVDTHVFRVSNRIGLTKADNVLQSEQQLERLLPQQYHSSVNHCLVLLGRYTCKARKPECERCPVSRWCRYYRELKK